MDIEKKKQQAREASARWRAKNPDYRLEYLKRTNYAAQKRWSKNNPDKMKEYARASYKRHAEKRRQHARDIGKAARASDPQGERDKRNRHYRTAMEKKVGRERPSNCELCNCIFTKTPHADHDHKTGEYRGWICAPCNMVLGIVSDNPELLRKMALWIEKKGSGI